jgi:hypothetical protein
LFHKEVSRGQQLGHNLSIYIEFKTVKQKGPVFSTEESRIYYYPTMAQSTATSAISSRRRQQPFALSGRATATTVFCFLTLATLTRQATSTKYYAVYYDPEDYNDFNPKGRGYVPVGPKEWHKVVRTHMAQTLLEYEKKELNWDRN